MRGVEKPILTEDEEQRILQVAALAAAYMAVKFRMTDYSDQTLWCADNGFRALDVCVHGDGAIANAEPVVMHSVLRAMLYVN